MILHWQQYQWQQHQQEREQQRQLRWELEASNDKYVFPSRAGQMNGYITQCEGLCFLPIYLST